MEDIVVCYVDSITIITEERSAGGLKSTYINEKQLKPQKLIYSISKGHNTKKGRRKEVYLSEPWRSRSSEGSNSCKGARFKLDEPDGGTTVKLLSTASLETNL